MIDRNEIIKETQDTNEWDAFSDRIEMLTDQERADIADRLNLGIPSGADWHDYQDAFGMQYWRDYTMAYEHVMGGTY